MTTPKAYNQLRDTVTTFMGRINGFVKIGRPGKVGCVDKTYFTKLKKARGGARFRSTRGHQTVVMARIELEGTWRGRKTTGRQFLVIIQNKDMATLQMAIERYIAAGTEVWTDGHASYGFLATQIIPGEPLFTAEKNSHASVLKVLSFPRTPLKVFSQD